jgi:hypothetical protein
MPIPTIPTIPTLAQLRDQLLRQCDTSVSNLHLLDAIIAAQSAVPPAQNPPPVVTPPATGSYDFGPWMKLTEPVDVKGGTKGDAREIPQSVLRTGYQSPFFHQGGGVLMFTCPPTGATTSGKTSNPRCELRGWDFNYADNWSNHIVLAVSNIAEGDKVVVHQIHEPDYPLVKVQAERKNGVLNFVALVKVKDSDGDKDTHVELAQGIALGVFCVSSLTYQPNPQVLVIQFNGASFNVPIQRAAKTAFGKAGNYPQSAKALVTVLHNIV